MKVIDEMMSSELGMDAHAFCKKVMGYTFRLRFDKFGFTCQYFGLDGDEFVEECGFVMPWHLFNSVPHEILVKQFSDAIIREDRKRRFRP